MRRSILTKLLTAFFAVALIVAAGGLFVIVSLTNVDETYSHVTQKVQPANTLTAEIQTTVYRQAAAIRGFMVYKNQDYITEYQAADKETAAKLDKLLAMVEDPAQREQVRKMKEVNAQYDAPVQRIFSLIKEGKQAEAMDVAVKEAGVLTKQLVALSAEVSSQFEEQATRDALAANKSAGSARVWGIVALAAGIVAAAAVGVVIARSLATPIQVVSAQVKQVAAGNLGVEKLTITSRDEVGELAAAFNQMIEALRSLIRNVGESTQAVSLAAGTLDSVASQAAQAAGQSASAVVQVAAGAQKQATSSSMARETIAELKRAIQQVATGSTAQAESSAQVTSTIAQLQQAIEQVASGAGQTAVEVQKAAEALGYMVSDVQLLNQNASQVAAHAQQSADTAARGAGVVAQSVEGMTEIRSTVGASAQRIRDLEKLSQQIGAITTTISAIADQTNLLALNAAIEAARAGDHGRGFAVVADEVRKLAERSARSAKEISQLIGSIQVGTSEAVEAMEAGSAQVERGVKLANAAGTALNEILAGARKAAEDVQTISRAAAAMEQNAKAVTQVFDSVASVTEENTAATEEMAASAQVVTHSVGQIAAVAQETAAATEEMVASSQVVTGTVEEIAAIAQENATVAEEVSASTEEVTASAHEVAVSATHLKQIAEELQRQVAQFRL